MWRVFEVILSHARQLEDERRRKQREGAAQQVKSDLTARRINRILSGWRRPR
jgi:hypothetical protein